MPDKITSLPYQGSPSPIPTPIQPSKVPSSAPKEAISSSKPSSFVIPSDKSVDTGTLRTKVADIVQKNEPLGSSVLKSLDDHIPTLSVTLGTKPIDLERSPHKPIALHKIMSKLGKEPLAILNQMVKLPIFKQVLRAQSLSRGEQDFLVQKALEKGIDLKITGRYSKEDQVSGKSLNTLFNKIFLDLFYTQSQKALNLHRGLDGMNKWDKVYLIMHSFAHKFLDHLELSASSKKPFMTRHDLVKSQMEKMAVEQRTALMQFLKMLSSPAKSPVDSFETLRLGLRQSLGIQDHEDFFDSV